MEDTKHGEAMNDDERVGDMGRDSARNAARETARETARDTARETARDTARDTGRDKGRDTGRETARAGTLVGLHTDPDATSHELVNEATEWLQYACAMTSMLSEMISEADVENIVNHPRLATALDGIGAMTNLGMLCAAEAHTRMCWERAMAQRLVPRTR